MAETSYINFSDYLDLNKDEIASMEARIRAAEQEKLAAAVDSTQSAGDYAEANAYWGEGPQDLAEYGEWQKAQDKQSAAAKFQDSLKTDEGQRAALSKVIGGAASPLEAALLFGAQEGGQKMDLGKYLGMDSGDFEKMNETERMNFGVAGGDYMRELQKKRDSEALWSKYDADSANWKAEDASRLRDAKRATLASEIEKKRKAGREFYASPDWNDWINYLSGEGDFDRSKESEYRRRTLVGSGAPDAPAAPGESRYSGRLAGTRADYERQQREKEDEEQRKNWARYY